MVLKILKTKTNSLFALLGFEQYGVFITLSNNQRDIYSFLDVIGFDVPDEPGTYKIF